MGYRARIAAAALGVSTVAVPGGGGVDGVPDRALVAYVAAARSAPCPVPWHVLAAVGAVESGHGTSGGAQLDVDGRMTVMAESWAGAQGPMQFMPATWEAYGAGGDVNDIDDAAPAAARLLCANGFAADPTGAVGAYNGGVLWQRYAESRRYVGQVEEFSAGYAAQRSTMFYAVSPSSDVAKERTPGRLWDALVRGWLRVGDAAGAAGLGGVWGSADDVMFGGGPEVRHATGVRPDRLDPGFGRRLDLFLAAAPGTITVVSGFRDSGEQIALRAQNCPDVWRSDSTECTPWTARPGSSDHEHGLAADLDYSTSAVEVWAHANAARFGLRFDVLPSEPWHVSLAGEHR